MCGEFRRGCLPFSSLSLVCSFPPPLGEEAIRTKSGAAGEWAERRRSRSRPLPSLPAQSINMETNIGRGEGGKLNWKLFGVG